MENLLQGQAGSGIDFFFKVIADLNE
jgi:hypothetical protein